MKTRFRHLITATACMLAAVLALASAAQLGIAVVCVGADGHVDIESFLDKCCVPVISHGETGSNSLINPARSCGDCVDVQLKTTPLKTTKTQLSSPDIIAVGSTLALSCAGGCRNLLLLAPANHRDQRALVLASLSTVVLLI